MSAHPGYLCVYSRVSKLAGILTIPSLTFGLLSFVALAGFARGTFAQTPTAVPVLTWRYDLTHAGQNTQETVLTPENVNVSTFGKLFSLSVDSTVYAQPLYVPNLAMGDGLKHNVLFVATENDSIYAFDADSNGGANANPIWQISLLNAAHGAGAGATAVPWKDTGSPDVAPTIGITGTPTINPATNTMYVVAATKENGQYFSRLHAINILTGAEQSGSPVNITASTAGTGNGSSGGELTFTPLWENQRSALNFYNGYVYFAYAAHGDNGPWHGWVFAYNATTLQQTAALCLSPDDVGAGVWGAGAGLPIDTTTGQMFIVTGNGARSAPFQASSDYGESVIALNIANGQLKPTDEWTAFNYETLNSHDWDQGAGGVLMLPDQQGAYPHELVNVGKEGRIVVLNRDSLGGYADGASSNTNAIQDNSNVIAQGEGLWATPAYWNGNVYLWAEDNVPMLFTMNSGLMSDKPASEGTMTSDFPTPSFSISSNGTQDGIAWAVRSDQFNTDGAAVLYAWNANDLSQTIYESDTNSTRDAAGPANKFSIPVVTNGKVYVPAHGEVDVYGLINDQPTTAAPVITPNGGSFSSAQTVTMTTSTGAAAIYYTLDGSTPTPSSTRYTAPITVSTDTTIEAIASAPGYLQSSVSTATFNFTNQTPPVSFSPAAGTYLNAQAVTISETDTNAKIYYTMDGSTPSASSTAYSGPIQVKVSETIRAIAIDPALNNSNIGTAAYVIQNGGTTINFGSGFSNSQGLAFNGSAVATNDTRLQLTNGNTWEAGSVFWNAPINIQSFTTNFEFQLTNAQGNGFTFTIQNTGANALGGDSAGLGYQGIQKSVAVKFNFYNYNNEGSDPTGLYTDGQAPVSPTVDISPSGIELGSDDGIQAQITYDGTTLTLNLHDLVNNNTFTYSWPIDIPQVVGGNTAYVGFTGGTGGLTSSQKLLSWTYTTQAMPPVFAPPAGTYGSAENVSLSSPTGDANIYYTTNGSTPSAGSTPYSAPIAVSSSETVKAIAISPTMGASNVVSAAYIIQPGAQGSSAFWLTGSGVSLTAGASAAAIIKVTPNGGFTGSVSLACSITGNAGAANSPTCTVAQPEAITGSQPVNATIAINTQGSTSPGSYTMSVTGTSGSMSASTYLDITVAPPGTGSGPGQFALSGTAINIASAGRSGTSTITVTPSGGFTGSVVLSCAVATAPFDAAYPPACSVSQPSAINSPQAVTATLTLSTSPGPSAAIRHSLFGLGGGSALAALIVLIVPRRRAWQALLGMILLGIVLVGTNGCSVTSGKVAAQSKGGTTAGEYTVTVTGTSGSLQATTTIEVTVQ